MKRCRYCRRQGEPRKVFALNRVELNRALSAASDELVDMIKKRENEIDIGATFKNMAMKE